MSNRSAAEMAGRVIEHLHEYGASDFLIRDIWKIVSDADFMPYQAYIDDLRELYGLDSEEEEDE